MCSVVRSARLLTLIVLFAASAGCARAGFGVRPAPASDAAPTDGGGMPDVADQQAATDQRADHAAVDQQPADNGAADGSSPDGEDYACGSIECVLRVEYCAIDVCSAGLDVPDSGVCPAGCEVVEHPTMKHDLCAEHTCREFPAGCTSCSCFSGDECSPPCEETPEGGVYRFPGLCGTPSP